MEGGFKVPTGAFVSLFAHQSVKTISQEVLCELNFHKGCVGHQTIFIFIFSTKNGFPKLGLCIANNFHSHNNSQN